MWIRNVVLTLSSFTILGAACFGWAAAKVGEGDTKGSIKGVVTYIGPVANAAVKLDGPTKGDTKTNENGEYTFSDVAAGDYKLEATGIAKNKKRKGSTTATMPETPKELKDINIKLEL